MSDDLDALVAKLRDGDCCTEMSCNCDLSADAITALRAQIARREEMHDCAMKERDDATIYADEQKARADRAEAALAAQIEADAGMLQDFAKGHFADGMVLERAALTRAAAIIRAQPHDRTALDKALAEAEARGYQLASDEAKQSGWHLRRYDLAKRDAELATP